MLCGHSKLSQLVIYFKWHPFSRSYGVILPSSLTRVLPRALEYSSHLPVSVYGTGAFTWLEAFLGSMSPALRYCNFPSPSQLERIDVRICLHITLTAWTDDSIRLRCFPSASPHRS